MLFQRFFLIPYYDDIFQLIHPTAIDPAGIFMLQSIRNFFELATIIPESIHFKKEKFNAKNIVDAFQNRQKKCPVITAADFSEYFTSGSFPSMGHVMVIAGALKGTELKLTNTSLADEWFLNCKNSSTEDPDQGIDIQ